MIDFLIFLYGIGLMMATYSYASYVLKIPGKAPQVVVRRIQELHTHPKELEEKYRPFHEKLLQPIAERIVQLIKINRLTKLELEENLQMAGLDKTPEEFYAKQLTTGLAFLFFAAIWALLLRTPAILVPGLVLAAFGGTLPARDLEKQIQEKKNMIIIELPDFLDMLIISLRAGRNLASAVRKAAEHAGPNLRPLLERLQANLELAENKKDPLWEFAESTQIQEVKDFVSALEIGMDAKAKQAEEIYRSQSRIMRDLRTMALKRYARSIPAKLNLLHVWLYLNCVAIPIIGAVMQFSQVMG